MKILILIFAVLAIILCLLQEDKNEGILTLGAVKTNNKKGDKEKNSKLLELATAGVMLGLFICIFITML